MGTESIMYVLVGTWWMAGTVYLERCPEADSGGNKPLESSQVRSLLLHARSGDVETVHDDMKRKEIEG